MEKDFEMQFALFSFIIGQKNCQSLQPHTNGNNVI